MRLKEPEYNKKYKGRIFKTAWGDGKNKFKMGEVRKGQVRVYIQWGGDKDPTAMFVHESWHDLEDVDYYINDHIDGGWILEDQPVQIKLINIK